MEGKEHGQTTEDFVANLVKGVLDRARHALLSHSGANESPQHLILDHALEEILEKLAATGQLMF